MTRLAGLLLISSLGALLAACNNSPPLLATAGRVDPAARARGGALAVAAPPGPMAPRFEVDPLWPKPLPNHWLLGSTVGVSVDSRDHVWIIHRHSVAEPETEATAGRDNADRRVLHARAAGDRARHEGNVVGSWGGPGEGYDWPTSNHGITVDPMDNVWIGGNDPKDAHMLKFSRNRPVPAAARQARSEPGSNDPVNFWRVGEDLDRHRRERRPSSPTATATSASS